MYGKIVDGELVEAPKIIKSNGRVILNPSVEILGEMGFKLMVFEISDGKGRWIEKEEETEEVSE